MIKRELKQRFELISEELIHNSPYFINGTVYSLEKFEFF